MALLESTSVKIITAIDTVFTLAIEHVGMSFHLPVYHPAIIGSVVGGTYVLIKHREKISHITLKTVKEAKRASKVLLPKSKYLIAN